MHRKTKLMEFFLVKFFYDEKHMKGSELVRNFSAIFGQQKNVSCSRLFCIVCYRVGGGRSESDVRFGMQLADCYIKKPKIEFVFFLKKDLEYKMPR